jgi:hypothetical protein
MHKEFLFSWAQKGNNYECLLSEATERTARRIESAITCLSGLEEIGPLS